RVIVILACRREARIAAVLVAGEVVPVVPAAGPLTELAPNGAHIPDLRRADLAGRHREQRRTLLHHRIVDDVGEQRGRTDAPPAPRRLGSLRRTDGSDWQ